MSTLLALHARIIALLNHRLVDAATLLFVRVAFAGIFWRSGETKVVDGTWFRSNPKPMTCFRPTFPACHCSRTSPPIWPMPPNIYFPFCWSLASDALFRRRTADHDPGYPVFRLSRRLVAGPFLMGCPGIGADCARCWIVLPRRCPFSRLPTVRQRGQTVPV